MATTRWIICSCCAQLTIKQNTKKKQEFKSDEYDRRPKNVLKNEQTKKIVPPKNRITRRDQNKMAMTAILQRAHGRLLFADQALL